MKTILNVLNLIKKGKGPSIDDRRSQKRYDLRLKLKYCDPATKHQGEILSKNISKNGLRFPLNTGISKGTTLDLEIEDPYSSTFIPSKAKIVWVKEFITGDDADDVTYEAGARLVKKVLF
ncbi:MAG: PilZ domain-containing protein [Candidatus Omnitrophica bacterium]|nr:PilZ domain-containing protein [Candidatus Omnitrophota bacterium]